ncbi:outer membrane protein [Hansschlegelia quercus]|uniref:Porin family protein n=1 Tax=Hansschlegelia quercus TaxID=2528245 RepID=A0A4Q9GN80_9HYPH|nr:outer membrane beta-barrel protein [Hansschlegelia quercus]TBN53290.1 porin family protein [Hansschlegelia quercus]
MAKLSIFALAGALVLAMLPAVGQAADLPEPPVLEPVPVATGGWYLRGDVGYKVYRDPKARYNNDAFGGNPNFRGEKMKDAGIVGGGVGYKWSEWFRTDVTADYETPSKFRGRLDCPGGCVAGTTNEKAKIDAVTIFANAYFDIGTFYGFTPYVGGGIGTAYLDINHYSSSAAPSPRGDSNWNFAWNLMAGVGYEVAPNVIIDANYRFVDLGKAKTKSLALAGGSGKVKVDDIQAHEFRVGVRYMLD